MKKPKNKSFTTPLIPPLAFPAVPEEHNKALELWETIYWEAQTCVPRGWSSQYTHFNPEYFLEEWSQTILAGHDRLRRDVWGWAIGTLRTEQEHYMGKYPHDGDMLKPSQAFDFLERFKGWCEARLAYHCTALRLTFYKDDPLVRKDPIASNLARVEARFNDWREMRIEEQKRLFETDPKLKKKLPSLKDAEFSSKDGSMRKIVPMEEIRRLEFHTWLEESGIQSDAIKSKPAEWLCWLHLITPISKDWEPREIALAILKKFAPGYRAKAKQWWKQMPDKPTYEAVEEKDRLAERIMKQIFPVQFCELRDDWLSNLFNDKTQEWADKLRKQLEESDFIYRGTRGRPKKSACDERVFEPDEVKDDLETDEPKGWMLAKRINREVIDA